MAAGIEKKASAHEDAESTAQRSVGQNVKQNWDCSQIEAEDEDEEWRKGDQMEMQWNEDEKLEEMLERRRVQAEVMQKVPELVAHERISQGEKSGEEQKKVKGWSTEEMKNKPRDDREEDTEEIIEWISVNQKEMYQCWKELAERLEED